MTDTLEHVLASALAEEDIVNNPEHYKRGGLEALDVIKAFLTPEEYRGYVKGNVIKYVLRERMKGGDLDLGKANYYLSDLIQILEGDV